MKNPYRWNAINTDIIYGRNALLLELLTELPSPAGNSFGLTGARRMGKTTVLRAIESRLLKEAPTWRLSGTHLIPIYIDGLALPRPLTDVKVWNLILEKLQAALVENELSASRIQDFSEFISRCTSLVSKTELLPKVIVIFDEIEHFIVNDWSTTFFANWRSLLSNTPELSTYFSAVFSGARELEALQHDIGSPLMDVLEWRSLRTLSRDASAELIRIPSEVEFQDDVVDFIYENTGGHPMIIQYIMRQIVGPNKEPALECASQAIKDFESKRSWQFTDWWNKYCSSNARHVYAGLPASGEPVPISRIAAELGGYEATKTFEILQQVGIVLVNEAGTTIQRHGTMFNRWQQRSGQSGESPVIDEKIAALLNNLGSELRDKYLSAWAIYSNAMANYSGAVSEMRDTITLVLHRLAPDADVMGQANFSLIEGQARPTRRQRVLYIFGASSKEHAKAVASDDELLETLASQVAVAVANTYSNASALTHTTATRPLAYTALKQGESILAQLLSRSSKT